MTISRRQALGAAIAVPLAAQAAQAGRASKPSLPDRSSFAATPIAYLDSASTHPISLGARAAMDAYVAARTLDPAAAALRPVDRAATIAKFARLVNADPDELCWVQSTTMGEQAVLRALGFPHKGGRVVTDTLHFYAGFPMYRELAKQGVDVAWVQARDGRIAMDDMAKAITPGTTLVSLSLVSTYNGFQHDLKAVCDLAHAAGALVYADIIHAAGAVPVDLHASSVDFAACATYKWLMGDFGLGFLYARRGVLDALPLADFGYYGFAAPGAPPGIGLSPPQTHVYPMDAPGNEPVSYAIRPGALGHFGTGTYAQAVVAAIDHGLDHIATLTVPAIQAHAQSLIAPLRDGLTAKGYRLITPPGTRTPLLTALLPDAKTRLADPLAKAQVRISLHDHHFRIAPSIFNDRADVDRLLAALPRA
ncbi:aminotransferase class V-fold PLP-dependent enzyme [Sphingobium cupriresistens]|uniref:Aminotransferase class V-fold PLP-dependent enzyme n=1 Tax=Sphingobium cupriresistens TaxID=1132417 RepID=A0A8G1ZHZ6_9SPHN|nr:aminotransferase class V-fold PLP-dependent enzyme [Sphingobium cupriresistens]RYM13453.1 aminotransferase class V-fold PLP-dependent enzyme [Sphingobium cupriresistens]